ncbi:MAG: hypothetical protein ACI8XO_004636 [Verrucomicrobiales bacterium]|jgi:hypothetical protein
MAGEEIRTERGKIYHDCKVISRDDYGIMIRHRDGAARLAFGDLPRNTQQRFKYDSKAASSFVKRHTHVPVRSSQIAHQRAIATHFTGFSPQLAATRAHLAFASGLLGAPFGGSLSVPGLKSFNAWQTDARFATLNPYHTSHSYKVKNGRVHLNNRRQCDRYDGGQNYRYAYQPRYNPNSYLQNQVRYGNHIAPAMNGNHIRATNGGNPVAPAMMSYSQFQAARANAIRKSAPVRRSGGGRSK